MQLLYLDRYHLDDLFFLRRLARALMRSASEPRLLVHGSGEQAERLIEGEGGTVVRSAGVLHIRHAGEAALVERGIREATQKVVATLTDELVAAVPIQGADRGLIRAKGEALIVRQAGWLGTLLDRRVVPVVSTLVAGGAGEALREAAPGPVLVALAEAFQAVQPVEVVFFSRSNQPGLVRDGRVLETLSVADLPGFEGLEEPAVVRYVVEAGTPARVTSGEALAAPGGAGGTRLEA